METSRRAQHRESLIFSAHSTDVETARKLIYRTSFQNDRISHCSSLQHTLANISRNKTAWILADLALPAFRRLSSVRQLLHRAAKTPLVFLTDSSPSVLGQYLARIYPSVPRRSWAQEGQLQQALELAVRHFEARSSSTRKPQQDFAGSSETAGATIARVLLIDDEELLRRALKRVLSPFHDVVEAADGSEAVALLQHDTAFDLVLCDLMMPGIDGPMVYEKIQRNIPQLRDRVVFVSGGAFTDRSRSFIAERNIPVLEKPISQQILLNLITSYTTKTDDEVPMSSQF